jgi:predicted MFS family arabinose efflux permease
VIIALLMMRLPPHQPTASHRQSVFSQFKEGWVYVFRSPAIRSIIVLLALVSLVGVPYTVLMPVFAGDVLKGGASTLGLLMTASGGGALLGALWLASRQSAAGLMRAIPFAAGAFGLGLVALSLAHSVWVAVLFMVLTGFGLMVQAATSNTVLQTIVEDEKRGRVMSFFLMAYLGSAPFGSLIAGTLSETLGVAATLGGGGLCCVAAAGWFLARMSTFDVDLINRRPSTVPDLDSDDPVSITSRAH